ncbi:MAG: SDR family oxidoreductase [Chromatiaceae bacterium]|nr:SDR family oxidoreductase [Chromatiaceae bacterium]
MRENEGNMVNKLCLVTGGTAGIGLSTAKMLAERGADLILLGRNEERGQAAVAYVKHSGGKTPEFLPVDLSDQSAIRAFAARFNSTHPRLDVLVNNAGGMFGRRQLSANGIEMTFALNHLAYFLLSHLLMPSLRSAQRARIVNVASDAHFGVNLDFENLQNERRYSGWLAYKRSKLCNLLFTYELSRRLEGTSITANALHPGFVNSEIGVRNSWTAGFVWSLVTLFAVSPERGAETSAYLASSSEVQSVSGKYFAKSRMKPSSRASYDHVSAKKLWDVSASLTQLDETALLASASHSCMISSQAATSRSGST